MARDVKTQLRITHWPSAPLPLPELRLHEWGLDADKKVLVPRVHNPFASADVEALDVRWSVIAPPVRSIKPSGETYLRLGEVDLDDPEAILGFVNQYGVLGGGVAYASLRQLGHFFEEHYGRQLDPRQAWNRKRQVLRAELIRTEHPIAKRAGDADDARWDDWLKPEATLPVIETLDEFRFAARCLQDLYLAWRVLRGSRGPSEFEWVSTSKPALFQTYPKLASLLDGVLRAFLSDFTPHLHLHWRYEGPAPAQAEDLFRPADSMTVLPTRDPENAPLYAVCALELFNHIADNAEYHECANERCKRTFVHQQGRSEKGQRRNTGVIYCTPECARATAQREYRRRRRSRR